MLQAMIGFAKNSFFLKKNEWLIYFFTLGIALASALSRIGGGWYIDPFHHGEYVASLPFVLSGNINFFIIHGALDWIPAWLSHRFYGAEKYFFHTMLIYNMLNALASVVLFLIIALMVREGKYRALILVTAAVLTHYLVGVRDVFLLLAILVYFSCEEISSKRAQTVLEITLGILLAVNLWWSFDRGIAGIVGIGLACLILIVFERRYLFALGAFTASIAGLVWIGALSLSGYVENIKFLVATSSQWSYGYSEFAPVLWTVLAVVPNALIIYYLGKRFLSSNLGWKERASVVMLMVLSIALLKIGTNRADVDHMGMSLWMPAIAFLYLRGRFADKIPAIATATVTITLIWLSVNADNYWILLGALIPTIYLIGTKFPKFTNVLESKKISLVVFAIPLLIFNVSKVSANAYPWLSRDFVPPPNYVLVSKYAQWVSIEMLMADAPCIFDLSNHGVINGFTGLPSCTKYIYPVYATRQYEADMLQQLQQSNPPVVVFSSADWFFRIDGKSMHTRFPAVTNYLVQNYPYQQCKFGYCLRYINQPGLN